MKNRLEELQGITIPYERNRKDLSNKVTEVITLSITSIHFFALNKLLISIEFLFLLILFLQKFTRLCYQYNRCISALCCKAQDDDLKGYVGNAEDLTQVLRTDLSTPNISKPFQITITYSTVE